jgi:hypothetical protein
MAFHGLPTADITLSCRAVSVNTSASLTTLSGEQKQHVSALTCPGFVYQPL